MKKYFPFLNWLIGYNPQNLKGDITAGITVAVFLIPQGMALALLAGLPPIVGLYAAVTPLYLYALFGTSRQLAVGPVALVSLLVISGVSKITPPRSHEYIVYATVLAAMVGIIQFIMGALRFGYLVNFLSHPVISGFTSAASIIIAFSQFDHVLGVHIPQTHYLHEIIYYIFKSRHEINIPTTLISLSSILLILYLKWKKPKWPSILIAVALSSFWVWLFDLESSGVQIMGEVPKGIPGFAIPKVNSQIIATLFPIATAIALVTYMGSIAMAKNFASKNNYEIDPNQELIGLGLANIGAGLFAACPVAGGFSRSVINAEAGAKTGFASMITALIIALTLLLLTNWFHYLPYAALSAIIIVAVSALFDWKQVKHLYKVKKIDLITWIVAFIATLSLGAEKGILISVAASLILVVRRTTNPHFAILGRLPATKIYRNVERYPEAITIQGLCLIRIDASLYFANVNFLKELITTIVKKTYPLYAIIFDASSVNDIDSSADQALHDIADDLKNKKINFYFTNIKGPVRDILKRSGFYAKLGKTNFFFNNHDAVKHFVNRKFEVMHETQVNN